MDINILKRRKGNGMSGKEEGGGGTGRRMKQDTKLRSIGCISNRGLSQEKKTTRN